MTEVVTHYEPVVRTANGPYRATALVGTKGVIIAWDVDESVRKGLLGFAVRRTDYDPNTGEVQRVDWLSGLKRFPSTANDTGLEVRSDQGPFQRFRWSDYTVSENRSYQYDIFPMRGRPGALLRDTMLSLPVRPSPDVVDGLGVFVNRGVTAANAYLRRFGILEPQDVPDNQALNWLSRGLKESLLNFINRAQNGDGLRVAIYEFHDEQVAHALAAARQRGVDVGIVFDEVQPGKKVVIENRLLLHETGLDQVAHGRTNVSISHNKFVVLLRNGAPAALWTGSSNFTQNAFYLQTNAALSFEYPALAKAYLDYWQVLSKDPERGQKVDGDKLAPEKLEKIMSEAKEALSGSPSDLLFSPVRRNHILDVATDLVSNAQSAVFVSAPFSMDISLKNALASNNSQILEYGLSNRTAIRFLKGVNKRNTRFFTPTRLKTYMGQAWDSRAFGAHKIHAKTIVTDPWSENPRVLFGSANFSDESCRNNDENALLIEGNRRLAAILTTEFMRMYDHYKSRAFLNDVFKGKAVALDLKEDEEWSRTAYDPKAYSHKFRDRQVFSGQI